MDFKMLHPAEQIVMLMDRIYSRQMTTTSGGNLSIMDEEGDIWITPSGIDKGTLTPGDICQVKPDGEVIGKYTPSVELPFHKLVYKTRPEARAVLHAHPPALVSFSLTRTIPNTRIIPASHLVCGEVGIAEYEIPGSIKLGNNIAEVFKKGYDVVMMNNHGVVVCAEDLFEAFKKFETLEFAAKLNIQSKVLGEVTTLTDEQIDISKNKGNFNLGEFIPSSFTSFEKRMRKEMCNLIHRSYDQKLFTSTQGTFSQRLSKDSFLITPYGVDRMYIQPEDIVRIDHGWREAGKRPSRSVMLHKLVYDAHPEINAITISHPTNIMAFGITRSEIDPLTIPESYINMRQVTRKPYGFSVTNVEEVANELNLSQPVMLIENDCLITCGTNLIKAFDALEVTEFTANTILHAKHIGEIYKINEKEVAAINKAFNLK